MSAAPAQGYDLNRSTEDADRPCHDSGPSLFTSEVPSHEDLSHTAGGKQPEDRLVHENEGRDYAYNDVRPANPGCRPKNVILFGEPGVGKSSVINLLAGRDVANVSWGLEALALETTEHWFTFPGPTVFRIFETVGLEEPEMGVNTFFGTIVKAHQLVTSLHSTGGVDLLLFCIRAGRITIAMQRNYRLFTDVLCGGEVPVAIVVTNLEQEEIMEDWWIQNGQLLQRCHIHSTAHTCITALPAHVEMYAHKRSESQRALRTMLLDVLSVANIPYTREKKIWLITVVDQLRLFLTKKGSRSLKKDLLRKLETQCMLPRSDVEKLAQLLVTHPT